MTFNRNSSVNMKVWFKNKYFFSFSGTSGTGKSQFRFSHNFVIFTRNIVCMESRLVILLMGISFTKSSVSNIQRSGNTQRIRTNLFRKWVPILRIFIAYIHRTCIRVSVNLRSHIWGFCRHRSSFEFNLIDTLRLFGIQRKNISRN